MTPEISLIIPAHNESEFLPACLAAAAKAAGAKAMVVGMQVPPAQMGEFRKFLKTLGYAHWDESDNPAYRLFLA